MGLRLIIEVMNPIGDHPIPACVTRRITTKRRLFGGVQSGIALVHVVGL